MIIIWWTEQAQMLHLKYKQIHKHSKTHVWIRWTPPVSWKKFSYHTEHIGTCKLQKGDRV